MMNWFGIYIIIGIVITVLDYFNNKYRRPKYLKELKKKAEAAPVSPNTVMIITMVLSVFLWEITLVNFFTSKAWKEDK